MAKLKTTTELLDAALEYASQGWYVFPIKPHCKKPPLIKDQYNNSSNNPEQIIEWWKYVPLANIGLDCGKSGVDIIDIDVKHEGVLKVLEGLKLVSGGHKAWDTKINQTPGGGYHYIFQRRTDTDGFIPSKSGVFGGPGIDARSKGGYIILPPSSLAEYGHKKYRTFNDRPIIPIPRQLLSQPGKVELSPDGRTELESFLVSNEPVKDGERNTFLHRVCSKFLRMGLAQDETLAALLAINKARCVPPYNEKDIVYLVKKSYEYYKPVEDLVGNASRENVEGEWNDNDETVAVNVGAFLDEQEEGTSWLLEGILPTSSLNMIQGNPKCGKSTMARHLAVAAVTGGDTLGISFSTAVPVLYYSLQESKKQWKTWLEGSTNLSKQQFKDLQLDIIWRLGRRGVPAIKGLRERLLRNKYQLVIIDMISVFLTVQDMDKYSQVSEPLTAMNDIAQETGACIVWLHHERKSGGGFEAGIGSQALRGAVYTTIKCTREAGVFSFSTEQREGEDTEDTLLQIRDKKLVRSTMNPAIQRAIKSAQATKKKT